MSTLESPSFWRNSTTESRSFLFTGNLVLYLILEMSFRVTFFPVSCSMFCCSNLLFAFNLMADLTSSRNGLVVIFVLAMIHKDLWIFHGCALGSFAVLLKHYRLLMQLNIFQKDNFGENFLFLFFCLFFFGVFQKIYKQVISSNTEAMD